MEPEFLDDGEVGDEFGQVAFAFEALLDQVGLEETAGAEGFNAA